MSETITVGEPESFKKLERLGMGGFAVAWRVRVLDQELIEEWGLPEVCIKIPLDKTKERALRREVELAGALHLQLTDIESNNIVRYLGFEVFEGRLVMIMKYVKGGSLRGLIGGIDRQKPVEIGKAIAIARGLLKGLSVIHEHHILHRDIKPENILMDGDTPKITDLGISRMLKTNDMASTTAGTLFYMSPELLYAAASFNTDLWSLGVTFYEMVCGQFPFGITGRMPPGRIMSLIRDDGVPLTFPDHVAIAPPVQAVIARALQRDPAARYKTAAEMLKDLERCERAGDEAVERELTEIQTLLQDPTQTAVVEQKLREIQRRHPNSPAVHLHFGEFYNKCGNHDKAIEMFRAGIDKDPGHAMLHWGLAIAYEKTGQAPSAIAALERALELGLDRSLQRFARVLLKTLGKTP